MAVAASDAARAPRRIARDLAAGLGLALLYVGVCLLGALAATQRGTVSPLWPASGVALWMAWRFGLRALLVVGVGALAFTSLTGVAPAARIGMAIASVAEAALGVELLRAARFRGAFCEVRHVIALVLGAAVAATAVGALIGVSGLCAAGVASWSAALPLGYTWWVGDMLGVLVVAPLLLTWTRNGVEASLRRRGLELFALLATCALVAILVFGARPEHRFVHGTWFLAFPVVAWAALRFGQRETALAVAMISAVATVEALFGVPMPVRTATSDWLLGLQEFVGMLAVTGLFIAAVTASHRGAEARLRAALSLNEATLDSTADGILVVSTSGAILTHNRRFAELWGLPEDLLASRDDRTVLSAALERLKDPGSFLSRVEELYARPEAESFDSFELRDGRTFERYSMPQREDGRIVGRVWSFRDVTHRRHLEAELRQAHKMDAIGRLAGGVAHEFNNLLTVMLGHAQLLAPAVEGRPEQERHVNAIQAAAERAATLTRHLLAFGRRQPLSARVLDLNQIVQDVEGMLRPAVGEHIELVLDLDPEIGAVRADPEQIQQALLHLAINGREAMPEGGRLTIRTHRHTLVDDGLSRELALKPGPCVVLSVCDTGVGMDAETRVRIFEPFFTTKEIGDGSGLGLSMVYGVVKQSGGGIRVTSSVGAGSCFQVYLPQVGERVAIGLAR